MENPPSQTDIDNELLNVHRSFEMNLEKSRIQEEVSRIWKSENTLDELLQILHQYHEGDRIPMMIILLGFIQGKITNMEETIYFTIHAEAGEGKSHLFQTASRILPKELVWDSGFSDKFLTRAKDVVMDGSIVCFDDLSLSPDIIQIMKICSNRNRDPIHSVLEGSDNKPKCYPLPKRLTFITIRVDQVETADYEQIISRNILVYADSSSEHMNKVFDLIRKRAAMDYKQHTIDLELFRESFWANFPPFFEVDASICSHLGCTKGISARQIEQCVSLMKLFAVYHHWDGSLKGKEVRNNIVYLKADRSDFDAAIEFYNDILRGNGGDQIFNLTPTGNKIRRFLICNYPDGIKKYDTYEDLAKEMGMNDTSGRKAILRALYGREDTNGKDRTKHVLGTVPGLYGDPYSETISDNDGNTDGRYSRKTFKKYPIIWKGNEYFKSCPNSLAFYWTHEEYRKYGD